MAPALPNGSTLFMRDSASGSGDGFTWNWTSATPLFKEDFGNPADGHTTYVLCLYDEVGATPRLIMGHTIGAGGTCKGSPCWRESVGGFLYKSRAVSDPAGIELIQLRSGEAGQALIRVRGRGRNLQVPLLPLHQENNVTVQLNDGFACWQADFLAPATSNQVGRFTDTTAEE